MDETAFIKWLLGGVGMGTLIKWLHARDNRLEQTIEKRNAYLEERVNSLESELSIKIDEERSRRLIADLTAPIEKDLSFLKDSLYNQDSKLDKILDSVARNGQ